MRLCLPFPSDIRISEANYWIYLNGLYKTLLIKINLYLYLYILPILPVLVRFAAGAWDFSYLPSFQMAVESLNLLFNGYWRDALTGVKEAEAEI
jgi:hypothetical protein